MNLKIRKTALVAGACVSFLLGGVSQSWAVTSDGVQVTQQTKKIVGTIVDQSGQPIIGANVLEKGTTVGTITDFDGKFSLDVKPGATLSITYIGYIPQTIKVGPKNNIKIILQEDSKTLDEVVVVGYGVQKKKLVTGATVQVKGEDLAKLNTTNALTAMQSSTPGVQITQSSSQPGKGYKVYIRGIGTTGNSAPLYVIDGVAGGSIDNINPADIESIDVLKDAASAAIYGARAANGVILVTTKQGKEGKIQASYDGYVGWSNAYKKPSLLNAQQYMKILDEQSMNVSGSTLNWSKLVPADIYQKLQNGWEGTDWWDLYANDDALQQNHAFNLTGGTDRSKFSMGLSYTGNEGIMGASNPSKYDRYTARINSDHVLLKGSNRDIIKIGENLSFYYTKSHDLAEGNMYWNIIHNALVTSPLVPAYNEDGSLTSYKDNGAGWSSQIFQNPLQGLLHGQYNSINRNRNFGVGATLFLEIEPVKNLKYRGQVNFDFSSNSYRNYIEPYSMSNTSSSSNYSLQQGASQGSNYSVENTLSYKLPQLAGNTVDFMAGQSIQGNSWGNSLSINNTVADGSEKSTLIDFSHAWIDNMNAVSSNTAISGSPWDESCLISFFGRMNWNYKERYMATATIRTDGSSNFARGHRWGTFPSFSAGWVISNEKFMESTNSWMDLLKLRASWGQNGNCNIANFQYLSTIAYSGANNDNSYKFNSSNSSSVAPSPLAGAYADILPNLDVTWETSEQLNIGLDARFLQSRLGLTFDWYNKKTKDWLIVAPIQSVFGTGAPYINGGDVENKGIEVGLNWNDNINRDFKYHAALNFAYNKNKVTKIANARGIIGDDTNNYNLLAQGTDYIYLAQVGQPIGFFYGMESEGIWQNQKQIDDARAAGKAVLENAQPGDIIWKDYNNDGKITYAVGDDTDRHKIGNPNPDFTMGLSFGFDYKGFDFNVTAHGAFGQQIMKNYRGTFVANDYENYTTEIFDRWHGEGTSNSQPRLCAGSHPNNQWISDKYMENGDFVKIQNVTIGYDFNKIWSHSPFQQLRIYAQAQNLYTFTNYSGCDPEIGSSAGKDGWASGIDLGLYPSARTYLVGVSIKF